MTDYGVQDDGTFERKGVDSIIEDKKRNYLDSLGEDTELRQSSPIKKIIDANAIEQGRLWQVIEGVYFAAYYEDSFGEQLDKQLALAGFSRRSARAATGEATFSREEPASDDIEIDEGTVVTTPRTETRPPIPFETTEDAIIREGETEVERVSIEALKPWQTDIDESWLGEETNVDADTISRFEDPISGVDDVTNTKPTGDPDEEFVEGRDRETDAEFKLRYENSLAEGGVSTSPAMESTILAWDDRVVSVRINEIRDSEANEYGVETTIFAPELDETDHDDLAQAILEARAAGVDTFGDESGEAEMPDGSTSTERFSTADEIEVYVDITLDTSDNFPTDGDRSIENSIIRYIGGEDHDEIVNAGLEIGEEVVVDQVKRRALEVRGVVSADVAIGDDKDALEDEDVDIGKLKAAMTGVENITIDEA